MALTDIDFSVGDIQNFIVEIPKGSLNALQDIVVEPASSRYPIDEISAKRPVFIMND